MFVGALIDLTWGVSLAWGQVNRLKVGGRKLYMLPCHSCYIYGTWRSKKVGDLKSSYGGKLKGGSHKVKGRVTLSGVEPSGILSQNDLPISASFG